MNKSKSLIDTKDTTDNIKIADWDEQPYEKQVTASWDRSGELLGIIDHRYGMSIFIPQHIIKLHGVRVYSAISKFEDYFQIIVKCPLKDAYMLLIDRVRPNHTSGLTKHVSMSIEKLVQNPVANNLSNKSDKNDKEFGNIEL